MTTRARYGNGRKLYPKLRHEWVGGLSYAEVGDKNKMSKFRVQAIMRRYTPDEQWPLHRDPILETRIRSRVQKRRLRCVNPYLIMGLVQEYCDGQGITLAEFAANRLGWDRARTSALYQYRNGHRTSMSGRMAAVLLRAIGEPVREDLARAK
jgi:hypothetical protein